MARLASGGVAATWQAAEDTEGEQTQHLRISVSHDAGRSWRPSWPLNITRNGGALWSPVPHVDSEGRVWVSLASVLYDAFREGFSPVTIGFKGRP